MASWFSEILGSWAWIILPVSLLTFVGTLILLPYLLIRIPEDYFLTGRTMRRHFLFHLVKNILGAVFLLMGFVMLFIPGQGILTILAGLWMMDIPGKRALEIKLVSRPAVKKAIDLIRKKAGRPSLRLPHEMD